MTDPARAEIFSRICSALKGSTLVGPRDTASTYIAAPTDPPSTLDASTSRAESTGLKGPTIVGLLFDRFALELAAVGGRAILVPDYTSLASTVAEILSASGGTAALQRSDRVTKAAADIPTESKIDASSIAADEVERASYSILEADKLIAETGSAIVRVDSRGERLLPYLPPACIIVANIAELTEKLEARWLLGDPTERGERVIVTGPSRTADIEKTIVLGAHGPASLTVIVVGDISRQASVNPKPGDRHNYR